MNRFLTIFLAIGTISVAPSRSGAQDASDTTPPAKQERRFVEIGQNDQIPTVKAILPLDGANVFFLNHRGQIGVAKFSPGLSQIGWDYYSEVKLNALPSLALGPSYSLVTASATELTQGFDTTQNGKLDFFQALLRDWPEQAKGTEITAGPVADPYGRILFALSPHALKPGDPVKARIMGWIPATRTLVPLTESELPIESFALSRDGLLATRLSLPDYTDGYFLSLTNLPAPVEDRADAAPSPMPFTLPSMIIPSELTKKDRPLAPTFFKEDGVNKLLLACPESSQLIEVVPEFVGGLWQGSILLRGVAPKPVRALAEMAPGGALLGGGDEGFVPLIDDGSTFRLRRLALVSDGILLEFNQAVDRYEAIKKENYSVKAIGLGKGETLVDFEPIIESDGKTVVLRSEPIGPGNVLRIVCQNIPSEDGEPLLNASAFFSIHAR